MSHLLAVRCFDEFVSDEKAYFVELKGLPEGCGSPRISPLLTWREADALVEKVNAAHGRPPDEPAELERLKKAAIVLGAAEANGTDKAHEEAECEIWAAGIAYAAVAAKATS